MTAQQGAPLTRDVDRDGVDDGREAVDDSDCDSVFDRYDPSNRDVGTSSEPTVFRGNRRATVSVRVTDGASVEHPFTATVVGTTWWLPTERVDESAEEFDLTARAWSVMSAPRNFVERFVAGRPRTFAEGATADEQVISVLTLNGSGTYSWTNPMSRTVEAFEPTWAMFECGVDTTLPRLRRLTPEALREPTVQRCFAEALSGATGTLGSAVPGAERTNCPGRQFGADWRITDWMNSMTQGLQPGVPRIMFCRVPSDGNRRYCEPVQGFSQYGCENGQTCGAGVTLPALLDGIHRRNLAGPGFPLPASLATTIAASPHTLQGEAGKETVFSSQSNSTITVPLTGQFGNWAQVAAVNLGQHTVVDTWTPAVVGVSLRAPDGSVAASNRVATLWPTELDGFLPTLSNPRPAQVVFSAGTLPRSLPPRPPFSFRVSVVEPGEYTGTSVAGTPLVVAGSPAAQVCTVGGPRSELSPGGRDPAVQHRHTVASGFLTAGRATSVHWNGRVGCAAHVVHSGSDYPLGGAGTLTPVQLMNAAPLRPGRYTLLVEIFKPVTTGCSERALPECAVIGGGGTRIRGTELTPGCFAGIPTVTEIPIVIGAEVVVAADADSRGSLSFPDGATINLREAAHRSALTRAVAARANAVLVGDDASVAMRFVSIPVTASRWWRPVQLLTTMDQSPRCAPASPAHRLGVTYSNRLFAEDFSPTASELGGGCVFLDLPGNEPHRLVQGFGRVMGLPPCPAGGCPFQVISLPQDRAANQTIAGACATVAQAYAPAVLHEGLHSFGWLHSFELSAGEQELLRTPTSVPVAAPRAESAASLVAGWQRSATRPTSTTALGFSSGQLFSCADLLVRGRPTACDRPVPLGSTSVVRILVPSADIRSSTPIVMSPFTDPAVERGREDRRTTNLRRSVLPFASIRDGAALQNSLPGSMLGSTFDSIEQARRMFGTSWTHARPMNNTSVYCGGP